MIVYGKRVSAVTGAFGTMWKEAQVAHWQIVPINFVRLAQVIVGHDTHFEENFISINLQVNSRKWLPNFNKYESVLNVSLWSKAKSLI